MGSAGGAGGPAGALRGPAAGSSDPARSRTGRATRARITRSPKLTSSSATVGLRPTFPRPAGGVDNEVSAYTWCLISLHTAARLRALPYIREASLRASPLHTQRAGVAAGEDVHHLLLEVIHLVAHLGVDAFLVHLPRAVDVFLQARVDVALPAPLLDLLLVVELDLGDQQARQPARLLVQRRALLGLLAVARRRR